MTNEHMAHLTKLDEPVEPVETFAMNPQLAAIADALTPASTTVEMFERTTMTFTHEHGSITLAYGDDSAWVVAYPTKMQCQAIIEAVQRLAAIVSDD